MNLFDACDSCSRYVRRADPSCPFCGAPMRERIDAPQPHARMSRGQWLAYGSAAVALAAGCSDATLTAPGKPDASSAAAGLAGSTDANVSVGPADASMGIDTAASTVEADASNLVGTRLDAATLAFGTGTFQCVWRAPVLAEGGLSYVYDDGGNVVYQTFDASCDRATQYCYAGYADTSPTGTQGCNPFREPWGAELPSNGACDGGYVRCGCVFPCSSGQGAVESCVDDDAGGITVECCGLPCYGAPPARLERLGDVLRGAPIS